MHIYIDSSLETWEGLQPFSYVWKDFGVLSWHHMIKSTWCCGGGSIGWPCDVVGGDVVYVGIKFTSYVCVVLEAFFWT